MKLATYSLKKGSKLQEYSEKLFIIWSNSLSTEIAAEKIIDMHVRRSKPRNKLGETKAKNNKQDCIMS